MRIAVVKEKDCIAPDSCNYICAEVCPRVREGLKETVYARNNGKAAISEELCISCGICVKRCPTEAIKIINLPDEMMKDLTFQYGINTFRTFGIMTPIKSRVVGLIGRNGTGKTTNINLVSNQIKPNFGKFDDPPKDAEVIKHFRGKEIQQYLIDLYNSHISVAKKPQDFYLSGKVNEIVKLNKYGLVPPQLMERESATLSGGESQLIEIARTLDVDANVYIFDEPMNYLDVTKRIEVATLIRERLKDKTVIVVEHDLIMLDYLTDFVQILYGSDGNYGIMSRVMQTRNGINNYISGYLPTENVRFRNYEIKIGKERAVESNEMCLAWPEFSVRAGEFELHARSGDLYSGEILGIIGKNGTGKTTFIKSLAGVMETSNGTLNFDKRIAFKPQIIPRFDAIVGDVLSNVMADYASNEQATTILSRLGVDKLINKNIKTLSGGELQKVAIVSTLLSNADLFLFDEPSANLDVEDRLEVMEIIRNFINANMKSAIVIDHDIMFIDSVCSRALVFNGTSGVNGCTSEVYRAPKAINAFLSSINITMRRDKESNRPRINQPNSRLDLEQKERKEFFAE
jgi:ATP-binding cassette subfamily E protein 1